MDAQQFVLNGMQRSGARSISAAKPVTTLKELFRPFLPILCLVPLLAVAGCATTHTTATAVKTLCTPWRAITYSGTGDTPQTVRQIRVHNKTGQNLGCWK